VLAVVAAGLINGNMGPQGMSPTTRIVLFNFWEYLAFLANSFVFLLIGLKIDVTTLLENWQAIAWAILAVLVSRAVSTYGLGWLNNRTRSAVPGRWLHVINWGGLRGAIALALALSLPPELGPAREQIRIMAFGVVLFTLLVQSTTMKPLLRALAIVVRDPVRARYELSRSRLLSFRSAARHLDELHQEGFLSEQTWEKMRPELLARAQGFGLAVRELQAAHPELAAAEEADARRELLRAQRGALMELRREGIASEEAFDALVAEIDLGLVGEDEAAAQAEPEAQGESNEPRDD
jgi:CPA1 family monovalent cation:H+ antiporter